MEKRGIEKVVAIKFLLSKTDKSKWEYVYVQNECGTYLCSWLAFRYQVMDLRQPPVVPPSGKAHCTWTQCTTHTHTLLVHTAMGICREDTLYSLKVKLQEISYRTLVLCVECLSLNVNNNVYNAVWKMPWESGLGRHHWKAMHENFLEILGELSFLTQFLKRLKNRTKYSITPTIGKR